jgi:hypothetical protein
VDRPEKLVQAFFGIDLHKKDLPLLVKLRSDFGAGSIAINEKRDSASYVVISLVDLTKVIIPHFNENPLTTKKQADFELFKKVVEKMNRKEHLTVKGLQEIVNLRASMNLGLTDKLKIAFPNTKPVFRPDVELKEIPDPH